MPSSRGSSWPKDGTHMSCGSCIAGRFFYHWATRETLDYPYSAIKRNEVLIHATTWMNLKCILLDERSQIPKKYMSCDSIYMAFWKRQNCRDGSTLAWAEDGGGIDYQGEGRNCEEKWKCSVSWLWWLCHDYVTVCIYQKFFKVYFWLRWIFIAVHGVALVAESRGYSLAEACGLLTTAASPFAVLGLSSCSSQA